VKSRYKVVLGLGFATIAFLIVVQISSDIIRVQAASSSDEDKKPKAASGLTLTPTRKVEYSTTEGTWVSLDVSPDGNTIVFDLVGHLYVMGIGGGAATAITSGMPFDSQPRFSPDGKRIVFVSDRSGSTNVWISNTDGSNAKQITSDTNSMFVSPSWTPDGRYVLVSRMKPKAYLSSLELRMYDVQGGSGLAVEPEHRNAAQGGGDAQAEKNIVGAISSPDGRFFYYATRSPGPGEGAKWQLARRDLRTGEEETITSENGGAFRPVLSPDGTKLVYATHFDGSAALRARDLVTGEERWFKHPTQRDAQESGVVDRDLLPGYAFTPDGQSILLTYGGKFHRLDVNTGQDKELSFEAKVLRELGPKLNFQTRVDEGSVEARLIQGATESPDGGRLAFSALGHLYTVKRGADEKPNRVTSSEDGEFEPAWSPAGKSLAYVTWSAKSGGAVWKVAADGGEPTKLTRFIGYYAQPAWASDGSAILALRAPRDMALEQADQWLRPIGGLELVSIPTDGAAASVITPAAQFSFPHSAGTDRKIFVTQLQKPNLQNVNYSLMSMNANGTDRREVLKLAAKNIWGSDFGPPVKIQVSPDGTRALALYRSQAYLFDLPIVGGAPPTIDLSAPAVSVYRLTDVGADFASWADSGKTVTWAVGSTYFRLPLRELPTETQSAAGSTGSPATNSMEYAMSLKPETLRVSVTIPRATTEGTVVLRGAKVITMRGDEVLRSADIVIHDNRIQSVGARGAVKASKGARVIDVKGATIVPGFIDTHAHWFNIKRGVLDFENWDFLATLAYGITAGRDPQTYTSDIFAYQDLADAGVMIGPRAYTTGPGLFATNDFHSEVEAEKVVSRYKDFYRTNMVKSYEVGDREQRQFVVEACAKLQVMPTTEGGAEMILDLTHAIDGFGGNEHQFPIASLYSDVTNLVAQSGIYYTPTFIIGYYDGPGTEDEYFESTDVYNNPKLRHFIPLDVLDEKTEGLRWHRKDKYSFQTGAGSARKIQKDGGKVCVGGHGELQGLSFHWQLWSLQAGGMSPLETLRSATLNGAEAIGLAQDLGTIEPGKLADLVILNNDPLEDIRNTANVRYVMKNGTLYDGDTLDEIWPVQKTAGPFWWWGDHP
jgi:imidazolonepropionase-like amidohydrolase/Tol biopolymer transport system component